MKNEKTPLRVMDRLGRITLPEHERTMLGWHANDHIQILLDEENEQIILRKNYVACIKCGKQENLKKVTESQYLCKRCIEKLLHEKTV